LLIAGSTLSPVAFRRLNMRTLTSFAIRAGFVLVMSLAATSCGDNPTSTPPSIQPQIINNTDTFSYQLTSVSTASGTWNYTWQNTGALAKVTHASDAGASGTATVTIMDAAGTQVYSGAFATSGETLTAPTGVAGAWTIRVNYSSYSNTQVNFAVVKQ
jgi:hypothetical protein